VGSRAAQRKHAEEYDEKEWYATGAVHCFDKGVGAAIRLLVGE
jgi:hypothetical protein